MRVIEKINKLILAPFFQHGLYGLLGKIVARIVAALGLVEDVPSVRRRLALKFYNFSGGKILVGPFKGLQLEIKYLQWSKWDVASIILGFYEKEVLEKIISLSNSRSVFIDVGAADGIYAVGLVYGGGYKSAICFEINELARNNIRQLSILNNVEKFVSINELANSRSIRNVIKGDGGDSVILFDIEGGEFDLFSDEFISACGQAILVIEVHERYLKDIQIFNELRDKIYFYYDVEILTTGARDLSESPFVSDLHDNERWLLCSEGRGWLMQWWVCSPKSN